MSKKWRRFWLAWCVVGAAWCLAWLLGDIQRGKTGGAVVEAVCFVWDLLLVVYFCLALRRKS